MIELLLSLLHTLRTTGFGASILSKKINNAFANQIMQVAVFVQNIFQFISLMMKFDKIRVQTETLK